MHLLATEPGIIADGSEAIDLAQTPGDIIMLASADTEIALLAAAQARRRADDPQAPTLRLAPVMRLGHNFSVDLYMETVARAPLVIARVLGGRASLALGGRAAGRDLPRSRHPAGAAFGRRQARPRTGPALDRAPRRLPPALALSRGR